MQIISFSEWFLIVLEIGSFLISLSNKTSVGLAERFDGRCLLIICLDSNSTSIIIIWVLLEFEGVFKLTSWWCMLVLDVRFGFAVTDDYLFAERVVILLGVFDGVFHLIKIGRKFEVNWGCVRSVNGGGLFR
jgi:hypothetical protein